MKLKGDYFHSAFHPTKAVDETISKLCPGDLSLKLWDAQIDHSHIKPVIASAQEGYQVWRKITFEERISYLQKFKEIAIKRKDEIAKAISMEVGKPYWESLTEAGAIAAKVDVTINESLRRIQSQKIDEIMPNLNGHTHHRPLGPCLIIGPYNFPCHLANGQILSALIAGNSIIFKPSEKTIYSGQLLIECLAEAGFPNGVINMINGGAITSSELTKSEEIKGIFFTGSHGVGIKILENTYKQLDKMVALELGGRNSTILHEDIEMEHALAELLRSCYLSTGQRCTSTSLIFVHKNILEKFSDEFLKLTKKIRIDHPMSKTKPFMGPIIDQTAMDLYFDFHKLTMKEGAQCLVEPKRISREKEGYYISPSLHYLEKPNLTSEFFQKEIFGPEACIIPYTDIEEAIQMANSTPYGLAASLFTQDSKKYDLFLRDMNAGILNLNRSTVGASSKLPFGGTKNSGNFHPAAVSMIDHCVSTMASLETYTGGSKIETIVGLDD